MSRLTLLFKGKVLSAYPLEQDEVVIGSAPDCDIAIDSLALHPQHARLIRCDDTWLVEDLAAAGSTFVNGQPISGEQALKNGDEIAVGKHTLLVQVPPAAPEGEELTLEPVRKTQSAWLQILNGHNVGKTISLSRNLTNLGKPGVQTAVIARRSEGYVLSHLEGQHPPQVNGRAIADRGSLLSDGDTIQMGNIKMQFYLE